MMHIENPYYKLRIHDTPGSTPRTDVVEDRRGGARLDRKLQAKLQEYKAAGYAIGIRATGWPRVEVL